MSANQPGKAIASVKEFPMNLIEVEYPDTCHGNARFAGDTSTREAKLVQNEELDTQKRSSTSRHFEEELRQRVVGQSEAVQALVDLYEVFCAGLHSAGRPVGNLLFLGPTGSGKTRTVEAAAEILFGRSEERRVGKEC